MTNAYDNLLLFLANGLLTGGLDGTQREHGRRPPAPVCSAAVPPPPDVTSRHTSKVYARPVKAAPTGQRRRHALFTHARRWAAPGVAALLVLAGCHTSPAPAPPPTSTVVRGDVVASVSLAGWVDAAQRVEVPSPDGIVSSVRVSTGDQVKRGQPLITLVDTQARDALRTARVDVDTARRHLTLLSDSPRSSSHHPQTEVVAQVDQARQAREQAEATRTVNSRHRAATTRLARRELEDASRNLDQRRRDLADAIRDQDGHHGTKPSDQQLAELEQATRDAETTLTEARRRLLDAENGEESGNLADQQRIDTSSAQLDTARARLRDDQTAATRTYQNAQSVLRARERALAAQVVRAPSPGIVLAVNTSPGERWTQPTGQAHNPATPPGTPRTTTTAERGSFSNRPPGVVTLADSRRYSVRALMPETPLGTARPPRPATITLPALGLTVPGSWTAADPTSTDSTNEPSTETPTPSTTEPASTDDPTSHPETPGPRTPSPRYGITVEPKVTFPAKVRLDQTAEVTIVLARRTSVLTLPTAAVRTTGGQQHITLISSTGQRDVVIRIGLTGGGRTEVLDGVEAGALVELPR